MGITEIDVLKQCAREPVHSKEIPITNLESLNSAEAHYKDRLKVFYKVWSGFTKYIRSQVNQSRCVTCPFIGKFQPKEGENFKYIYTPSIEILESGEYRLTEDAHNV